MHLSLWLILWKLLKEHLCPEHNPGQSTDSQPPWSLARVIWFHVHVLSGAIMIFYNIYFINSKFQLTETSVGDWDIIPKISKLELLSSSTGNLGRKLNMTAGNIVMGRVWDPMAHVTHWEEKDFKEKFQEK